MLLAANYNNEIYELNCPCRHCRQMTQGELTRKCWRFELEPAVGIEPTTDGLQNRCSAAELSWLKLPKIKAIFAVIPAGF
jgi:hypothetical protein